MHVRPLLFAAIISLTLAGTVSSASQQTVFLPLVSTGSRGCTTTTQEARIAELMRSDAEQKRPSLTCNPLLEQVARERARDMAVRKYFGHVNPDGYGPNYIVLKAGYRLPDWWKIEQNPTSNYIEWIAAGTETADETWNLLMKDDHRIGLLALDSFYKDQIYYGIGSYTDSSSNYGTYWVIITAPPE